MTSARTDAAQYAGRISVRNPATLLVRFLCGARRRLCSGRPGCRPVFLVSEVSTQRRSPAGGHQLGAAGACRWAGRQAWFGRRSASLSAGTVSAVSERPRDGAADPRMAGERGVSVPHGPLKCEGQLITTSPSLDVDQLIAVQATESDRSCPPSIASATRERDDRNRRATALKLLPHSLASCQLAAPRVEPRRMRSRGLTTGRRVARLAGQRLAARARPLSPAARGMHCQRRTEAPASRVPMLAAARGRGRRAVRAPLIQPRVAVAHGRSCAPAPRARSRISSPFFWREPTLATPDLHLVAASCGPANGRWGESRGERRPRVRGLGWPALTHPRGVAQRLANSRDSR
jgi:hypothetical protein